MDDYQLHGCVSNLNQEFETRVQNSLMLISCVTQAYAQSNNCLLELKAAVKHKKPIIALMVEAPDMQIMENLFASLANACYQTVNAFEDPTCLHSMRGRPIDSLNEIVRNIVQIDENNNKIASQVFCLI
jgi:hypothetical protein